MEGAVALLGSEKVRFGLFRVRLGPFANRRKRAEYCFESTVSDKRTH